MHKLSEISKGAQSDHCYVIAEAGLNHNGSVDIAKALIDVAVIAGADAVKFQAFKPDYNAERGTELHDILMKTKLNFMQLGEVMDSCNRMDFILSPFDIPSVVELASLHVKTVKIPSGKITDVKFLEKVGCLKRKVILSTGMSTMEDVSRAIDILLETGTNIEDVTVLHCTII